VLLAACSRQPNVASSPNALAPPLPAVASAPEASSAASPIEKITVDVSVRTRRHKPVFDLDPSQIAISDDGSPVRLSAFHRVDLASGPQHLAAFLFDRLDAGEAKTARRTAEKILSVIPDQGYSLAVLQVNGRLHLVQGYTQDFHATDTALAAATPISPAPPSATLTPAEDNIIAAAHSDALNVNVAERGRSRMLLSALEESQRMLEDRRSSPSLVSLQALVQSDRQADGRKFIFFFCSGITSNSDARERLRSIVALANRLGVTIYVIDLNPRIGSMSSAISATSASALLGNTSGNGGGLGVYTQKSNASTGDHTYGPAAMGNTYTHDTANFEFGDIDPDQSPLVTLSAGTGGMYFNALDDSKRKLQELREELTSWYQASWVPPIQSYDGQFRPIDIHSPRKDLVIRARSGYFAVPPAETADLKPFEMPLLQVLSAPKLPADLPMQAGVLHLGSLADGNSAEFIVQVPVSQLEVHEDANTHTSTVQAALLAVIKDHNGKVLQTFGEDFPLHKAPSMFHADSGEMITLARSFSAQPGAYTLDAVVMDRLANKMAARHIAFTIEPLPAGPALSDIAIVHSIEPVEETHDTFEPMRYRDGRIVPSFATDLPANTRSLPFFFLLHPVAGSQSQPVLRMQIYRDSRLLSDIPMDLQDVSGTGGAIPYLATINGHAFPPGDYQVKALFTQNGTTASSVADFRVTGDQTATNGSASGPAFGTASGSASGPAETDLLAAAPSGGFTITTAANPIPPPSDADSQRLLESARQRALDWSASIQNFLCVEVTRHFVDTTGQASWKQRGTLMERLRYVDHTQTRSTIELNGEASSVAPDQLEFFHSSGEFGAMFHIIFDASAKASFTWKQAAFIEGQPVQVYAFHVDRAHSSFNLTDRDNHVAAVGFSGLLFIDPATGNVRRATITADDIPASLLIRNCSMSVDYSWITMQNHDFLLPIRGAVGMHETKRHPVLNEFAFRDYRRFGSQVHILSADEIKNLAGN
jgi:VWFA-related protein